MPWTVGCRRVSSGPTSAHLITVVIPVFNREATIAPAVRSALREADESLRVIVVDDGSNDGTAGVVASIGDERVALLQQENRGVSAARNRGWRAASSEYVTFLDSDDSFLPGWWSEVSAACRGGQADLWSCAAQFRHRDGRLTLEAPEPLGSAFGGLTAKFLAGTFVVRRNMLVSCGGYLDGLRHGENSALGIALGEHLSGEARVAFTNVPLVEVDRRSYPYDAELLDESGTRLLQVYGHRLALDPKVSATMRTVAGWAAVRNGRRRVGVLLLWSSWRLDPWSGKRLARLIVGLVRPSDRSLGGVRRRLRRTGAQRNP